MSQKPAKTPPSKPAADKPKTVPEMICELDRRIESESRDYVAAHLRKAQAAFPDYVPFSHPARDVDLTALMMWRVLAQCLQSREAMRKKSALVKHFCLEAQHAKAVALPSKFTTIIE